MCGLPKTCYAALGTTLGALVTAISERGVAKRRRDVSRTDLTTAFIMYMIRRDKRLLAQEIDFATCVACIPTNVEPLSPDTTIDVVSRRMFHAAQDAVMKLYRFKTKGERINEPWIDDIKGTHFGTRLQPAKRTVAEVRAYVSKQAPSSKQKIGGCDDTSIRSANSGESKATSTKAESGLMTIVCPHLVLLQMMSLLGSETFTDAFTLQTLYVDAMGCEHFSKDNCCAYIKWLDVHASALYNEEAVDSSTDLSFDTKQILKSIFDKRKSFEARGAAMIHLVSRWHQMSHVPLCQELRNQLHVASAGTGDGEYNERHNRVAAKLGGCVCVCVCV